VGAERSDAQPHPRRESRDALRFSEVGVSGFIRYAMPLLST
jgi:hypothetical protein